MSDVAFQKPVTDSVPKINREVAVGEDLDFQRRWWKFESVMWWGIAALLLLNLCGAFGRGPLAHAQISNDSMTVNYERVERTGTPSILKVQFQNDLLNQGKVQLYVSYSLVEELGTQRVIPSPLETAVGKDGLTYTFVTNGAPGSVEFALQPSHPGLYHFTLLVPGHAELAARIFVVP